MAEPSVRGPGRESREQCLPLRPVFKLAALVDVSQFSCLYKTAAPLACSRSGMLDPTIWIVRARYDERTESEPGPRRIGEAGGLDGEGGSFRIRDRNEECASDPC